GGTATEGAAFGGITAGGATATGGRGGAVGGLCCCSSLSLSSRATSPGLEIFERSILDLISGEADLSRAEAGPDLAVKCFLIFSASSSSMELEWLFFPSTPRS